MQAADLLFLMETELVLLTETKLFFTERDVFLMTQSNLKIGRLSRYLPKSVK